MERVCRSYDVIGPLKFSIASIGDHLYHLLPLAYVDNNFGPTGRVGRSDTHHLRSFSGWIRMPNGIVLSTCTQSRPAENQLSPLSYSGDLLPVKMQDLLTTSQLRRGFRAVEACSVCATSQRGLFLLMTKSFDIRVKKRQMFSRPN